jgi:6-pyruvoyltetrahydropterin/6-carboxytetrahydropterin synthase
MYTLIIKSRFEAAHFLPEHPGMCRQLHGHSYHVEVEFTGKNLNSAGMLTDFGDLKAAVKAQLPDHQNLNDVMEGPTTTENIAKWLFDKIALLSLPISAITVWETEGNGCRYTP